jgi:hypothetical protein
MGTALGEAIHHEAHAQEKHPNAGCYSAGGVVDAARVAADVSITSAA